ncbi:MAG: hypothetical protein QOD41_3138 [Cryptosporangiaceae bacterium]|nr:hypothetical protein [Cryptosporangiaceae bacterium]
MFTPAEQGTLELRISADRLAPYRATVGGDLSRALALYAWNRDVSAAFAGTLGDLEVMMRNSMHEALAAWSAAKFGQPRWYLDPGHFLEAQAQADIAKARQRATSGGRAETPGRVVAELGFGFWRFLLASRYDRTFWVPGLRHAFPHHRGLRRTVHDTVKDLHLLRNRIAHLEPIHNRPLTTLHTASMTVAGWICPVGRRWLDEHCGVQRLLACRP